MFAGLYPWTGAYSSSLSMQIAPVILNRFASICELKPTCLHDESKLICVSMGISCLLLLIFLLLLLPLNIQGDIWSTQWFFAEAATQHQQKEQQRRALTVKNRIIEKMQGRQDFASPFPRCFFFCPESIIIVKFP